MLYERQTGVPKFVSSEFAERTKDYVVLIPIINEGNRILKELYRAYRHKIAGYADIVICDGGSTDGCTDEKRLRKLKVNTLLVKQDAGKQGAQLRMGIWWALQRGYQGIITIDGNNKDSIEDVPHFIEKLKAGYDLVQGSRTSVGPHRDDICFMAKELDIRRFGSQGQQRTAALSLKLSEIELVKQAARDTPVLLLDDVLSELDKHRQNYLLDSINDIQTLITCTGVEDFVNHRFSINKVFHVHNGQVTNEN